ncbi:hypothetical protein GQ53DRAFT_715684 [Thozetella sp. PMI_491]|nr:hypothetical protein GQ53DRAFT_715684 [Thozetella sp. PMI_491]
MDSPRPTVDLEKELVCSICTELLYQPLTLLDCLHTFDGACVKEWFSWQAQAAESALIPPDPDSPVFTCPSCRAPVRNTQHNATVTTLLDLFLAANPEKVKPEAEKEEMDSKYKIGERVLPKLNIPEKTPEQRRLDEVERRLVEEVRELSLREAVAAAAATAETRSSRASREASREPSRDSGRGEHRARDARERARRQTAEENRRRAEASVMLTPELPQEDSRRQRSGSRQRSTESTDQPRRLIEHQSSIRSLISRSDTTAMDSRDVAREIEDFTKQIQEEGLLDGIDLDNIDLNTNDELSRRITEAYRRRHRERARQEGGRRSNASAHSHRSSDSALEPRPQIRDSSRPSSRHRAHSGPRAVEERGRYPPSSSQHLEVQEPRRRRRTTSGGRSATVPVVPTQPEPRTASRSQTDLGLRSQTVESPPSSLAIRPSVTAEARSSSTPTMSSPALALTESPGLRGLPFSARVSSTGLGITQGKNATPPDTPRDPSRRAHRPTDLVISPAATSNVTAPVSPGLSSSLVPSPRSRAPRYLEPNISCRRCCKEHIEYELHYNCAVCDDGRYNICLNCYRQGKGCLHWFGFGRLAHTKWENVRAANGDASLPEPHLLKATRYLPPKTIPGGADGRRTISAANPLDRLQSGAFCSRCFSWANECYWRCDLCNDADWGFCNDCVNQGRCCTHPLLPLGYQQSVDPLSGTPPGSPTYRGSPQSPRPPTASVLTGPNAVPSGPYLPLTFTVSCDACRLPIGPLQNRHHCYSCVSLTQGPDSRPGDYNLCESCYAGLIREGSIAAENGIDGWRRCLQGHRMVVVRFVDGPGGQRRIVAHDLVGGRMLRVETLAPGHAQSHGLQIWSWSGGAKLSEKYQRLVSVDVKACADAAGVEPALRAKLTDRFPAEGGCGPRVLARWAWYPEPGPNHGDELLFPKGAEITEVDQFDEAWFHGTYMGAKGVFPAPYVRTLDE